MRSRVFPYIFTLAVALICATNSASSATEADAEERFAELTERVERLEKMDYYAPKVFGAIMAYNNISTYNGDSRFNVRFSRFGVRGRVSDNISYLSQVDFSAQGNLLVLDAYVKYANAQGNLDFTLGQQLVHFNSNIDRGPAACLFMSRSFCAIYLLNYAQYDAAGEYTSAFLGARDIGASLTYTFRLGKKETPLMLGAAIFNGDGINNPQWNAISKMSYLARFQLGDTRKGVSGGANAYYGNTQTEQEIQIYSGEVRYQTEQLFVEAIYSQRRLRANFGDGPLDLFQGVTFQGYYTIPTPKSKAFKNVAPLLRWDGATGISYQDVNTGVASKVNAHRITPAVNIAMKGEKVRTRLSVAYEKVFTKHQLTDFDNNYALVDRVSVGFTVVF